MNKNTLLAQIVAYLQEYPNDAHPQKTLDFLNENDNFWQKENSAGHVTASVWIVNGNKNKALLTHHKKLEKWFQLGGHVESEDEDIFAACLREAKEESGLQNLILPEKTLFDIDVHLIPTSKSGFPAHFHYDIRVLLIAEEDEAINFDKNESKSVKWFDFEAMKTLFTEESLLRMIAKSE